MIYDEGFAALVPYKLQCFTARALMHKEHRNFKVEQTPCWKNDSRFWNLQEH